MNLHACICDHHKPTCNECSQLTYNIISQILLSLLLGGSFPYTIGRITHGFDVRPDLCAVENNVSPR